MKDYKKLALILIIFIAFIGLGLPDSLLGIAWPAIRTCFELPLDAVGMLLTTAVSGYLVSSFLSGPLIARWGIGYVLAASCALTGGGLIGYTIAPSWWMVVALGTAAGLGAGAIDTGLNTYVAAYLNDGLMQWMHASYGIGVTAGPVIMTYSLTALHSWRVGYNIVGIFQLTLAACFLLSLPLWNRNNSRVSDVTTKHFTEYKTTLRATLRRPRVWLSLLIFFIYVGAEVSLGTWAYSLMVESRTISPKTAGLWASLYWATFTIGRIVAGPITKWVTPSYLVRGGLIIVLPASLLLWWNPFPISNLIAIALIGFGIGPIFPAMVSGTSERVNARFAANTIGMQMTATGLGMALIPAAAGIIARRFSLEIIPIFIFVLFTTFTGLYALALKIAPKPKIAR